MVRGCAVEGDGLRGGRHAGRVGDHFQLGGQEQVCGVREQGDIPDNIGSYPIIFYFLFLNSFFIELGSQGPKDKKYHNGF